MQQRSSRFARLALAVALSAALVGACAEGGSGGAPDASPTVVDARVDGPGATTACVEDNERCPAAECCHYGTCVAGAREGDRACTPAAAGECTTAADCADSECCLVGVCLPGTAPTPSSCVPKRD